jgi:glycosyltransferase involved in cell wall biosynthesis
VLDDITPLIITRDEAPNIERTLDRLRWARRIVILDSGSADGTIEIAARHPQVDLVERPFDTFAGQCNAGLREIRTPWVLSLDADYVLQPALIDEMRALSPPDEVSGYMASFRYLIDGRPLRGSLYPPRVVLYRRDRAHYVDDGHGHRVQVAGGVRTLRGKIDHDDRKPRDRWLQNQRLYAAQEAEKLLGTDPRALDAIDRLRRLGWLVPILTPLYCLLFRGLILDGRAGLIYTAQRTHAEALLARMLWARRATPPGPPTYVGGR